MSAPTTSSAVRDYTLLGMAALAVLGFALASEGYGAWALLPVVPGILSLLTGWSVGPALVLVMMAFVLAAGSPYQRGMRVFVPMPQMGDVVLAAAAVVFVGAQMRLQSLIRQAVPRDSRRKERAAVGRARGRWVLPAGPTLRSPDRVRASEIAWLLLLAGLFAVVGYLMAFRLQLENAPGVLQLRDDRLWRGMLVACGVAAALAGGHAVVSAIGWMAAGRDEARVYLQDQLWSATRGEQRRIQQWMMRETLKREGG